MWCWIVGCLVGFEGSGRKRYDLILSHCCIACLEFPKKVKKIRGKECCLLILPVLKTTANGLTKYMEQRLCWEADKFSCSQENPRLLPRSQEPATCPYPEPGETSPCPQPTCWLSIFPSTPRSSKLFLSLRFSHQNPICTFTPCVVHAQSILLNITQFKFCCTAVCNNPVISQWTARFESTLLLIAQLKRTR